MEFHPEIIKYLEVKRNTDTKMLIIFWTRKTFNRLYK